MTRRRAALLTCAVLLVPACDPDSAGQTLDLPPRPPDAPVGSELVRELRPLDLAAREQRIFTEVARGNVPGWLRRLERVEITREADGDTHRLTFWVIPDYLSVGSDTDFFLVPLSPRMALRIADLVGGSLPTPIMVDAVWLAAGVRLVPIRIRPNEHMGTMRYFERHDRIVQAQRSQHGAPPGAFVAGHKLDVVLPAAPVTDPEAVGLYGWHLSDGTPIQPLYRVPVDTPPHFSMGVRVVHRVALIDGARRDLSEVLRDPRLGRLLAR